MSLNIFVEKIIFHKISFSEMKLNGMPSGMDLLKMLLTLVVSNDMVDGSDSGGVDENDKKNSVVWIGAEKYEVDATVVDGMIKLELELPDDVDLNKCVLNSVTVNGKVINKEDVTINKNVITIDLESVDSDKVNVNVSFNDMRIDGVINGSSSSVYMRLSGEDVIPVTYTVGKKRGEVILTVPNEESNGVDLSKYYFAGGYIDGRIMDRCGDVKYGKMELEKIDPNMNSSIDITNNKITFEPTKINGINIRLEFNKIKKDWAVLDYDEFRGILEKSKGFSNDHIKCDSTGDNLVFEKLHIVGVWDTGFKDIEVGTSKNEIRELLSNKILATSARKLKRSDDDEEKEEQEEISPYIGIQNKFQSIDMTETTLPNNIIKTCAFVDNVVLKTIKLPNSVTSIGNDAFGYCLLLTSITIPDSVTSIGDYAFCKCESSTSVIIPNSVTSIGNHAFDECSSLTSITIPDSVNTIGDNAFYDCSSSTSVIIPNSVTSMGEDAFENYGCLKYVITTSSVLKVILNIDDNDDTLPNDELYHIFNVENFYVDTDIVTVLSTSEIIKPYVENVDALSGLSDGVVYEFTLNPGTGTNPEIDGIKIYNY